MQSGQFFGQMLNERDWEKARRPYYNLWPSIIPMLTRLDLDLDSNLIQLPLPALCIRFPKDTAKNPLKFDWKGDEVAVRCVMLGEINQGTGLSVLVDIGEVMGEFGVPVYTYRSGLGRGQAYRGHPAFPPPAHDVGVDRFGPGGAKDRASPGQHRASGGRGKVAEWVWGNGKIGELGNETKRNRGAGRYPGFDRLWSLRCLREGDDPLHSRRSGRGKRRTIAKRSMIHVR
jgi:hypothetical protein